MCSIAVWLGASCAYLRVPNNAAPEIIKLNCDLSNLYTHRDERERECALLECFGQNSWDRATQVIERQITVEMTKNNGMRKLYSPEALPIQHVHMESQN